MADLPADAVTTIVRYQDQVDAVRAAVLGFVRRVWGTLDSWRDADIARFVAAAVPVVEGGQVRVAALTDNYLATIQRQILGGVAGPLGVPAAAVSVEAVRGVPAEEVYGRSGQVIYRALGRGEPLSAAVAVGLTRALNLAGTDLQLARTHSARYVGSRVDVIVGFRRVLSANACSLCQGSTHRFGADELMPIHGWCSCGSVPVYRGGPDPGEVDVGASTGADRGTPIVRDHGEIGPVLTSSGDDFTEL